MTWAAAVMAQAGTNAAGGGSWSPDSAVALLAALIGALVGGAAAAWGSRLAMRSDLRERNRHALLMEDWPRVEKAINLVTYHLENDDVPNYDDLDLPIRHIKLRASILSKKERDLGELIPDQPRGAEDVNMMRDYLRGLVRHSQRVARR